MHPSEQAAGAQQIFKLFGNDRRSQGFCLACRQYSDHPALLNAQKVRHQSRPEDPFQTITFHAVAEATGHADRKP